MVKGKELNLDIDDLKKKFEEEKIHLGNEFNDLTADINDYVRRVVELSQSSNITPSPRPSPIPSLTPSLTPSPRSSFASLSPPGSELSDRSPLPIRGLPIAVQNPEKRYMSPIRRLAQLVGISEKSKSTSPEDWILSDSKEEEEEEEEEENPELVGIENTLSENNRLSNIKQKAYELKGLLLEQQKQLNN